MKGLTLVELIITLAIIGTLIMLGIPTYARLYSFIQLWGEERRFTSDLREYQQKSISDHYDYRFTGLSNKSYKIEKYDGGDLEGLEKTVVLQQDVVFESATYPVFTFQPLGNVTTPYPNVIVMRNIEGETSTITINPTTGHVSIKEE